MRDGAVVIDGLGDPELVRQVHDEMTPHIETTPQGSDRFAGQHTRRSGALIARSPASRQLVQHPLVLDVTGRLLHQASNFQLHLIQSIAIGPGQPAQPIHRDQWAFDFFPFPADHHVQCNTIWALTDFTERRRRQHHRRDPHRRQHHLRRRLAPPGGEPVPLGAPRRRQDARRRLLRLMGYRTGAYALGDVDDVRDPREALRGRTGTTSFRSPSAP